MNILTAAEKLGLDINLIRWACGEHPDVLKLHEITTPNQARRLYLNGWGNQVFDRHLHGYRYDGFRRSDVVSQQIFDKWCELAFIEIKKARTLEEIIKIGRLPDKSKAAKVAAWKVFRLCKTSEEIERMWCWSIGFPDIQKKLRTKHDNFCLEKLKESLTFEELLGLYNTKPSRIVTSEIFKRWATLCSDLRQIEKLLHYWNDIHSEELWEKITAIAEQEIAKADTLEKLSALRKRLGHIFYEQINKKSEQLMFNMLKTAKTPAECEKVYRLAGCSYHHVSLAAFEQWINHCSTLSEIKHAYEATNNLWLHGKELHKKTIRIMVALAAT